MRVGSLVKIVYRFDWVQIGVIAKIGTPNPIATIHWSNGQVGSIHTSFLEVLCE